MGRFHLHVLGMINVKRASRIKRQSELTHDGETWVGQFDAMASSCEILMSTEDEKLAEKLLQVAAREAWRIEQKFSRYRVDSMTSRINTSQGKPVVVDLETTQLIDFAFHCYELSNGLFDISTGILRKAWPFKQDGAPPPQELIDSLLPRIGLEKAAWQAPEFTLPAGMQIDFGGIGKEYAVDRVLQLLMEISDEPMLVNFGGDLACNRCADEQSPWQIHIENPSNENGAGHMIEISSGALATSSNMHRFLLSDGRRHGHLLNPITGWPIAGSPLSISVAESNCTHAGMLATLAMLQGNKAEEYLEKQEVRYWTVRESYQDQSSRIEEEALIE